jgi:hypothetical protein
VAPAAGAGNGAVELNLLLQKEFHSELWSLKKRGYKAALQHDIIFVRTVCVSEKHSQCSSWGWEHG